MTKMSPLARRLSKMVKTPKRFQRLNWIDRVEKEKTHTCQNCHTCSEEIVNCGVCGKLTEDGDNYREHLVNQHDATVQLVEELFNRSVDGSTDDLVACSVCDVSVEEGGTEEEEEEESCNSMTPVTGSKPAEAKVMVSNLPLLFARGSPTSLESMCLEELQGFLRFVLKCEMNLPSVDLTSLSRPAWWPPEVEWGEAMLQRREQRGKTSTTLRSVIRACYTYHECLYLLEFCRKLISYTGGIENLQVVDNRDGTRSLLNRGNKKLLVTFRAENQDYDQAASPSTSGHRGPQRSLLPGGKRSTDSSRMKQLLFTSTKSDNTSDPSLTKCVDVYLCDNCDKDFDSLQELISHEESCGKKEVICLEEGISPKDAFLANHFKLAKVGGSAPQPRKLKESQRPKAANYDKFMDT